MEQAASDSEPGVTRPVDMDLAWTRWALGSLAELVEIHLRTARMTATEQLATPITRTKPDFALAQARLGRSVRLSIAMSQRVRETYLDRKAGKVPERTPAEEAVAEAAPAEAAPKDGEPRAEPRESLTETECLEDGLEPGEEAEDRRDLDASLLPRNWDAAAAEATDRLPPDRLPDDMAEVAPVSARPAEDWRRVPDESDTDQPWPRLPKPDSS